MKYPEPIKVGERFMCPVCKQKDYKDRSGYRYHYKSEHLNKSEIKEESKGLMESCREIADMVLKELPKRTSFSPKVSKTKENLKPETWVLLLSDSQFGLDFKSNEVGGMSEYSPEIFKERLQFLAERIVRIKDYHPNPPTELVIPMLGDMVDGSVLRGNHPGAVRFGVVKQTIEVVELLTEFLIFLSRHFSNIKCFGVYGNHGRLTRKPNDASPADNFDLLTYHIIKERIRGIDNISMEYAEAQHMIVQIADHKFWLEHGETVRSWMGIPFYGAKREKASIQELMGLFGEKIDYVLLGHHHQVAKFANIYLNGSFTGGDTYSIGRLRAMGIPSQVLLSVNHKYGVVWDREIKLVEDVKSTKIKIYQ